MSTKSHTEMHREHTTWRMDDELWRDEVGLWETEIRGVIADLPRFESALRAHATKLQRHAAQLRLYEQDFAIHEQTLAHFERGDISEGLLVQAQEHGREAGQHQALRKSHDEIKKLQRALLTKWTQLFAVLVKESPARLPRLTDH